MTNRPELRIPQTPVYKLVALKMREAGMDLNPVEYIAEQRGLGVSYAKIAEALRDITGESLTHELPRRWHLYSIGQQRTVRATARAAAA